MERILKTIFWTVIVLIAIVFIGQVLLWLLPFIIIAGAGIYFYGKYKLKKFTKEDSYNETYTRTTSNTIGEDDDEIVEVVDVEFKDAE